MSPAGPSGWPCFSVCSAEKVTPRPRDWALAPPDATSAELRAAGYAVLTRCRALADNSLTSQELRPTAAGAARSCEGLLFDLESVPTVTPTGACEGAHHRLRHAGWSCRAERLGAERVRRPGLAEAGHDDQPEARLPAEVAGDAHDVGPQGRPRGAGPSPAARARVRFAAGSGAWKSPTTVGEPTDDGAAGEGRVRTSRRGAGWLAGGAAAAARRGWRGRPRPGRRAGPRPAPRSPPPARGAAARAVLSPAATCQAVGLLGLPDDLEGVLTRLPEHLLGASGPHPHQVQRAGCAAGRDPHGDRIDHHRRRRRGRASAERGRGLPLGSCVLLFQRRAPSLLSPSSGPRDEA